MIRWYYNTNMVIAKKNLFFVIIILILIFFGFHSPSQNFDNNSVSVFMYHRFGDDRYPSTNIQLDQFELHINEVIENNYNITSIDEVINNLQNNLPFQDKSVAFTIDDAHESFFLNGWPIFKKNKIPVTLFVSTSIVDDNIKGYMTWDQIREFIHDGGDVGQHTASHNHMPTIDKIQILQDLKMSHQRFIDELGFIPKAFAFPYGETSLEVIETLKEINIESAFGQHSGVISNKSNFYYLPRYSINENFGGLDRFIMAANSKALNITNLIPNDMYLDAKNDNKIKFNIPQYINYKNINCYANFNKEWIEIDLIEIQNKRIQFDLNKDFDPGRRRFNCTTKFNDEWYWFGYQFLVK